MVPFMSRCLFLAGLIVGSGGQAEDESAMLQPLSNHAISFREARWPCAFVGDLTVPASGEGAHPFGGETPLRVPADLRRVTSEAHFESLLSPQFVELCTKVATQHSTLECAAAVLEAVHHAARQVCSSEITEEPTSTISYAKGGRLSEAALPRTSSLSQLPLKLPAYARDRIETRARAEWDASAQQPKLPNRFNTLRVNVTFAGADSRSPKVLPCNWAEDVAVLAGNVPLTVPMHLSIDGRNGAPVKSFAQAFSFLRENLRATCSQVVVMQAQSQSVHNTATARAGNAGSSSGSDSGIGGGGSDSNYDVDACVSEIEDGLVSAALKACPSREPLQHSLDSSHTGKAKENDRQITSDLSKSGSRTSGQDGIESSGAVLHVRSLAGDELEHYWHFFVGELLPTISAALQTLRQLPSDAWTTNDADEDSSSSSSKSNSSASSKNGRHGPSNDQEHPVLTVVVHNPLRPWGASPLHGVYAELTAASGGALVFRPSPYDCLNTEVLSNVDDDDDDDDDDDYLANYDATSYDTSAGAKEFASEASSGVKCRGVAVVRLPRWDYEARSEDLKKLAEAADFLSDLLLMHSSEINTGSKGSHNSSSSGSNSDKGEKFFTSSVSKLQRIVHNSLGYLSSMGVGNAASSRSASNSSSSIGGRNARKPALTMVVQQRSHDATLGSFYSKYFCGLIASGDLPYLSKEGCGRYGSQTRHVAGLPIVASQLNATHADLNVVLTAPDGGISLADQATPYLGADLLLLGHGGGMAHALWMHAQQAQQRLRRRNTQPAIVLEITSAAKHAESNGAARGLSTLAQARNAITQAKKTGRETNYWPLMTVRRLVCTDTNAYAIDLLGGSSTISNGSSASSSSDSNSPSTSEFSGDVSDVSTPCGVLLQSEVNEAILRLRAWHDRS